MLRLRLSRKADKDFDDILDWSEKHFGSAAAARYYALLRQSFLDLRIDPDRIGSKPYPELLIDRARIYPLTFSRMNVAGKPVADPRHILLYRVNHNTLFVARILHDRNDLPRHVPKSLLRRHS